MLEEMVGFHSVSGNEKKFALWFKDKLRGYAAHLECDKAGNLIGQRSEKSDIGLFVHMDIVGFMVKRVCKKKIEVVKIGTPKVADGTRVVILGRSNEIVGILIKVEEDYIVDVGAYEGDIVQNVEAGDFVAISPNYYENNDVIISNSLDNKIGCFVGMEVFKTCPNAILVGTVKEEHKTSGAIYAATSLANRLKAALIIDVTYDEYPFQDSPIKIGKGPAICLKDTVLHSRELAFHIISIAKKLNIPYQIEVIDEGLSDASVISHLGIPFVFIGIPIRYMHSASEVANWKDIRNSISLISAFLQNFNCEGL